MHTHKKIALWVWERRVPALAIMAVVSSSMLLAVELQSMTAHFGEKLLVPVQTEKKPVRKFKKQRHWSAERRRSERLEKRLARSAVRVADLPVEPSSLPAVPVQGISITLPAEVPSTSSQSAVSEAPMHRAAEDIPEAPISDFPAFGHARYPIARVPNWGAMMTPEEWERTESAMTEADYVPLPRYDLAVLTTPLDQLLQSPREDVIDEITAKLTYSTRHFSAYDIDLGEFTGTHAGIDLKLALGAALRAIGGGRVHAVAENAALGTYIMIEHRIDGETYYSIYGHLGSVSVSESQDVTAGQTIGTVGVTGTTTGPHVHFQIDRKVRDERHIPYAPSSIPSRAEAEQYTVHPIRFIEEHR